MYKTIRHGENSLQYTILPQNDDFRLEGGKSKAGSAAAATAAGAAGAVKKNKTKKPKRRSFFAYLGLIFVCTVIVGAVLVPFLVSAECLPNPTEWFLKTRAALTPTKNGQFNENEHKPISGYHINPAVANSKIVNKGNLAMSSINVGKTVKIINKDGVEKIILKVNKTAVVTEPNDIASRQNIENDNSKSLDSVTSSTGKLTSSILKPSLELKDNANSKSQQIQISHLDTNEVVMMTPTTTTAAAIKIDKPNDIRGNIRENMLNDPNNPTMSIISKEKTETPTAPPPVLPAVQHKSTATIEILAPAEITTNKPLLYSALVPNIPRASLQSTLNQQQNIINSTSSISTQPTITTRIMQVPLLKSTAKKPAMPPVLVKNLSNQNQQPLEPKTLDNNNNNLNDIVPAQPNLINNINKDADFMNGIKNVNTNADWIHTHWPYIDPSTYFQWNGYKAEDSVLLPALLGFALIGVILIITVCIVYKRTIVTSVRRNRNDIEENGAEDNTTLLTNTNLSDED